jgi:hypothetical protein
MVDSQNNVTKKVLSECAFSQNMWKKTLTSLSSPTEQGCSLRWLASVGLPDAPSVFTGDTPLRNSGGNRTFWRNLSEG